MCNTVQLGLVPALSQVLPWEPGHFKQGLEVRCVNMGNGGEGEPIVQCLVRFWGHREEVGSSLFLSLQGQLHRSCLNYQNSSVALCSVAEVWFLILFLHCHTLPRISERVKSFLIMVKYQPSISSLRSCPCVPFFKPLQFTSLIVLFPSKPLSLFLLTIILRPWALVDTNPHALRTLVQWSLTIGL